MRKAARAIVLHEGKLLVMHRNKFGKEYDTLPGGNVEAGETPEGAVRREVHEETGMELGSARLVFIEESGQPYGTQYIYLCDYVDGEPKLSPGSEEAAINKLGKNLYKPMWINIATLPQKPFLSRTLKERLLTAVEHGFPETAETFTTEYHV